MASDTPDIERQTDAFSVTLAACDPKNFETPPAPRYIICKQFEKCASFKCLERPMIKVDLVKAAPLVSSVRLFLTA